MSEVSRELAMIAAAVGLAALLLPLAALRSEAQRAAALALTLAAWGLILVSLLPDGADLDELGSPGRLAAVAGALALAAVALAIGVRVVLARPAVWFVLVGLTLPIRLPVSLGGEQGNLLVPLYGVIVLGLAAWIWGRARGRVAPAAGEGPAILTVPLVAFVGYLLVSVLWSADPQEAAKKAAFFYIPFALLYALTVAWWPHARALRALAVTTILGAGAAAGVALFQYATREIWWNETLIQANRYSRFFRVNGIFYDPNILGRYLVIGILVCVALAWVRSRRGELVALVGATALMTGGLAVTFSRSSALMLMVGLALLAVRAVGARRALVATAALVVAGAGIALAGSENVRRAATDGDRLERVSEGRFDLMRGGLTIWRRDPVAGAGLGGFERRFEETLTPLEQRRVRVVVSHNSPVTVLSEGGAIGFALFLALIAGGGWAVARGSRGQGDEGWARWTLSAVLAGILVHSLLYAALFEDPFLWVATGAAIALAAGVATRAGAVREVPDP